MSNFSKIVVIIILVLSFFFIKEKTGFDFAGMISNFKKIPSIQIPQKQDSEEKPDEVTKENEKEVSKVSVYFLALDSNDNSIYKKVTRELPKGEEKLNYAIEELLKGPNIIEKASGTYSEIPKATKLLKIKDNENSVIIDFSSDFQYGGGTDSIYSRMMQLIKTSVENSDNKKIYLYLDGKQIKFIGGEGIMVSQPLSEKSLEN